MCRRESRGQALAMPQAQGINTNPNSASLGMPTPAGGECGWFYGSAFATTVRREVWRVAVVVINGHGRWPAGAGTAQAPVIEVRWLAARVLKF